MLEKQIFQETPFLAMKSKITVLGSAIFPACILFVALCFSLVFSGCESVKEYVESPATSTGQITVYLKGPDKTPLDITFDLQAINILAEDGTSREIMNIPQSINSLDVAGRQILLSNNSLPAGRYKKLQFIVKEALIKRKESTANLALPTEGIFLDIDLTIYRNQSSPLFLDWNVDASIEDNYLFKPSFFVKKQVTELSSLLIYVTNEDSNNVSVINRQTGDIVANIMVGNKPRGIAVSLGREKPRVYVANSGSNSVSIIDPTMNKVEIEIPLRFGIEPEGIAVMSISPERELLFITNYGSDTVSIVDALSYQEILRVNVGNSPIAVAVDPPLENFFGSRFLSASDIDSIRSYRERFFNVYVANMNSRNVTIITMDESGRQVEEVVNVDVEWGPIALTVDSKRAAVYVANYNYDSISVIDMLQVVQGNKTGSVRTITDVGTNVIGVIADSDLDRMYLLKDITNEIVIIRPFSEAYTPVQATMTMSPVIGTIAVGSSPRSFMLDPEERKIYIVNRGSDTVSEIDKTTRREIRTIPVGKRPYGIAMFPY